MRYCEKKSSNSAKSHSIHFGTEDNRQGSLRIHLGSSFPIVLVANLCILFNTHYSGTAINNIRKSITLPCSKFSVFSVSDVLLRFLLCRLIPYQKWIPCCSYDSTSNRSAVAVSCVRSKVVHTATKTFPEVDSSPPAFLTEQRSGCYSLWKASGYSTDFSLVEFCVLYPDSELPAYYLSVSN